jgi:hypothetical protein
MRCSSNIRRRAAPSARSKCSRGPTGTPSSPPTPTRPRFHSTRPPRQACFRPVTQAGLPLIGRVPQIEGVYVATGHDAWGILHAPAAGEALAELIADGVARSIDLTPFDPMRLKPLDPSLLRSSRPASFGVGRPNVAEVEKTARVSRETRRNDRNGGGTFLQRRLDVPAADLDVVLNDVRSTLTNRRHRTPTSGPLSANNGPPFPCPLDSSSAPRGRPRLIQREIEGSVATPKDGITQGLSSVLLLDARAKRSNRPPHWRGLRS